MHATTRTTQNGAPRGRRAYTLVELLITVTIIGIAGAMVIPSFGSTGVLRVQSAVRTIVADINVAQSEAVALQKRRAIVFDPDANSYSILEVNGPTLNPETDTITTVSFGGAARFGDSVIDAANFGGTTVLVFDELGGPVTGPDSTTPSSGGTITVRGSGSVFRITVEAYTGRVTVARISG